MGGIAVPQGLSRYEDGQLITDGPDVCNYKSRLKEIDPTLEAYYDREQLEWIVTALDGKNTRYFVLADKDLASAYTKVQVARNDRPGALTGDQLDDKLTAEQNRAKDEDMQVFRDIGSELGERLLHAFKKDGILDHDDIYGPKSRRNLSARDVRIR